ncbi:MAG: hypothetical protein ACFFCS_29880, partial [Candidatus Hodarchaeota archaeon]
CVIGIALARFAIKKPAKHYYNEEEGVMVSKDRLGWKASCGLKLVAVADQVNETEYNLEKSIIGLEGVRFRVLISRGVFGKEVEKETVQWNRAKPKERKYLAPEVAGCSWYIIMERRLRTLARTEKDIEYIRGVFKTVSQGFYQHYNHFHFVPMTGRELVEASIF